MRGLTRVYVAVSAVAFALALGSAGFLAAAAWIVPDWTRASALRLSAALSTFAGDAGHARDERPSPSAAPDNPPERASPRAEEAGTAALAPAVHRDDDPGARTMTELAEKIEAWETLRGPILHLLELLPSSPHDPELRGAGTCDVRLMAHRIAARLRSAAADLAERPGLEERTDPRTLARILLDEKAMSDGDAVACLRKLTPARASEVLDRLSRLAPDRAGRLLRALERTAEDTTSTRGS